MNVETESRINKKCESDVTMVERDIWGKFRARCHGEEFTEREK